MAMSLAIVIWLIGLLTLQERLVITYAMLLTNPSNSFFLGFLFSLCHRDWTLLLQNTLWHSCTNCLLLRLLISRDALVIYGHAVGFFWLQRTIMRKVLVRITRMADDIFVSCINVPYAIRLTRLVFYTWRKSTTLCCLVVPVDSVMWLFHLVSQINSWLNFQPLQCVSFDF